MTERNENEAEAAFSAGNYFRAAQLAVSDELRGCALVLTGAVRDGLALLEAQPTPRAAYHRGFALWSDGKVDAARDALHQVSMDAVYGNAARMIVELLDRGVIRLLVQGRDDPANPAYDFVGALKSVPSLDVITVGYSPRADIMINYSTTLDDVMAELPMDWEPDLYICQQVEDNPPPLGIEDAPFTAIAHTHHYDQNIHHTWHYLQLFDATVVLGSDQHDDLSRISHARAFVFPLLDGDDGVTVEATEFETRIQRYLHFLLHVTAIVGVAQRQNADPIFSRIRYPSRDPWTLPYHYPDRSLLLQLQDQFRQAMSGCAEYACLDAVGESFLYSALTARRLDAPRPELDQALMSAALSVYQGVVTAFPDRIAAWFNLGRICFELNEEDTAKVVFDAILANPQMHYEPNDLLFWREVQDGMFDYARMMGAMMAYRMSPQEHHLRAIEKLIRESVEFYLANIALAQGKAEEALALLRDRLTDKSEFAPSWMLRAILNLHSGNSGEASSDLQTAVGKSEVILSKLDPSFFRMASDAGIDVAAYEERYRQFRDRGIA